MKKYLTIILLVTVFIGLIYSAAKNKSTCPFFRMFPAKQRIQCIIKDSQRKLIDEGLGLLIIRKDNDALVIFEQVLAAAPQNQDALWGKAEVLRRSRDYKEAEGLLNKILNKNPKHISSLNSLAYIRYKDDKLNESLKLVNKVLKSDCLDKKNEALAYLLIGTINGRRASRGWLFSRISSGTRIKCFFLRAKELAPDLPEVHLALGTFYLLAPSIVGGNLNKGLEELKLAVEIAPDFATANARLAQAYKKRGNLQRYNFHIQRAKRLDPQNEVLKELE
jgi:tetratricopeptide (TPR) repeat protein